MEVMVGTGLFSIVIMLLLLLSALYAIRDELAKMNNRGEK